MKNQGINKHPKRETKIMLFVSLIPIAIVFLIVVGVYVLGWLG